MNVARLRRALKKSPRDIVQRVLESARYRSRRPWARIYPRLLTESAVLRALGATDVDALWEDLARQPFFVDGAMQQATVAAFRAAYPGACEPIVAAADAVLRHEFDLLGSGPRRLGSPLPWHTDFKTGREWPLDYSGDIEYNELDQPTDVKVPWELSRCQHFTRLGQAYWLTQDERYANEFVAETTDWIAANPLSLGVNWACAMDVALRAVSWIWGFHFLARSEACRPRAFRRRFLRALYMHGDFVVRHLEKADVNGNHYLCDGVGLVFLGLFFGRARAAQRWLALGCAIVEQEILRQTTADGVDFEQSTAYHRLVLEAFLTSYRLLDLHGRKAPDDCWRRLERMCEFVQAYTKPDGRAPLIGDADDGRIQVLGSQPVGDHRYLLSDAALLFGRGDFKTAAGRCWEETFWVFGSGAPGRFQQIGGAPPAGSTSFPEGGFYVIRTPDSHLIVDCGDVGMRGRGGHGHNDILGFELFMNGFNVVTDCGAYVYTASREWRNRFRSTAFHSTVQIDDEELNRFLAPDALWQLRDDARPIDAMMRTGDAVDCIRGGHTGYRRLSPPVSSTRAWIADRRGPRVLVRDRLDGQGRHSVVWRFHLDPAVEPEALDGVVRLTSGGRSVWLLADEAVAQYTFSIESGWVSPSYGVKIATKVLVWRTTAALPIEASYLFAEANFSPDERRRVRDALIRAAAC